jgi:hypothetical protein
MEKNERKNLNSYLSLNEINCIKKEKICLQNERKCS